MDSPLSVAPKNLLAQRVKGRGEFGKAVIPIASHPEILFSSFAAVLTDSQGAYIKRNVFEEEMRQLQQRYSSGTLTESDVDLASDEEGQEVNFEVDEAVEEEKLPSPKKVHSAECPTS